MNKFQRESVIIVNEALEVYMDVLRSNLAKDPSNIDIANKLGLASVVYMMNSSIIEEKDEEYQTADDSEVSEGFMNFLDKLPKN